MLVDSHTHLLRLEVSPEAAVEVAAEVGVLAVVNIGTDVEDSRKGGAARGGAAERVFGGGDSSAQCRYLYGVAPGGSGGAFGVARE